MARITYQGYSLRGLREWARDLKVAGRSKMTGDELLAACRAASLADIRAMERAVLPSVRMGALLRHKSGGDIVRVTGDVFTWMNVLCVPVEYVETGRWGTDKASRERSAAYDNECATRRTDGGPRHPLWQYEAVTA